MFEDKQWISWYALGGMKNICHLLGRRWNLGIGYLFAELIVKFKTDSKAINFLHILF